MKSKFFTKMPNFKFAASAADNTGILVSKTWKDFSAKESDRAKLPVLHTKGYANTLFGQNPDDPALINPLTGVPAWVEPAKPWGTKDTLLRVPRSIMLAILGFPYDNIALNPTELATFSDHHIFFFGGTLEGDDYHGIFTYGLPWASTVTGSLGGGATGLIPTVDPTTFIGGEILIICGASSNYYNESAYNAALSITAQPSIFETTLLANDIAQCAAALPQIAKLRFRIYGIFGRTGEDDYYTSVAAQAVAAGIDASWGGEINPTNYLSLIQADYHSFFGF